MAINRYTQDQFPVTVSWTTSGKHTIKIENVISSICVSSTQALTDATIGSNIEIIADNCFKNCTNLTSVQFVNYAQQTGTSAVIYKTLIDTVGNSAFENCPQLTTINFNDFQITHVGNQAFKNCSSLISIDIDKNRSIGTEAFANCSSLTSININSTGNIGQYAFINDNRLQQISLCADVISQAALSNCSMLNTASIKVNGIDSYAFANCGQLENLNLTCNTLYHSRIFENCNSLKTINITDLTGILDTYADGSNINDVNNNNQALFQHCNALSSVIFSDSLKRISYLNRDIYEYKEHNQSNYQSMKQREDSGQLRYSLFKDCKQLKEIRFDIYPGDDATDHTQTDTLQILAYPSMLANVGSNHQLSIYFNDTRYQVQKILRHFANTNDHILDRFEQITRETNNGAIFIYLEDAFDPTIPTETYSQLNYYHNTDSVQYDETLQNASIIESKNSVAIENT